MGARRQGEASGTGRRNSQVFQASPSAACNSWGNRKGVGATRESGSYQNYSDWEAPIVVVPKSDGAVRICGDYKVTINPVLQVDQYPVPKADDLFATLAGEQKFSKLDISQAYQQVLLEEESRKYVTINTHKGLYRYNRLPFGIASAPAIFQQTMEKILQGLSGVTVYIDDILVTGRNDEEHLVALEAVLR